MWDARSGEAVGGQLTAGREPDTDRTFLIDHYIGARPSFSADGAQLATPSFDGTTIVWELAPEHWVTAAWALVGRDLTDEEWRQHVGTSSSRKTCGVA